MTVEDQRQAWNRVAGIYQNRHQIGVDAVQYGPLAPNESELHLLGTVAGQHILEIGCGGGQNCVALARAGATVIGVDISNTQIEFARQLAAAENVSIDFRCADAVDLSFVPDASQDLVLAVYLFPYIEDVPSLLAECARTLRPGGQLVISQDHPIRACYWDEEHEEESILPARSYFEPRPLRWSFAETGTPMISHHRTIGQWFSQLCESGFVVKQTLEFPLPPGMADEPWADEYTSEVAIHLPQTMILVAQRQ
ncbi:MAG: class I SAM-dependent methyltransferase [Caldilineaceae bacterium]|nr:class I SAM-dependent methyltransferase [Caldilineaceae bacterium]